MLLFNERNLFIDESYSGKNLPLNFAVMMVSIVKTISINLILLNPETENPLNHILMR